MAIGGTKLDEAPLQASVHNAVSDRGTLTRLVKQATQTPFSRVFDAGI